MIIDTKQPKHLAALVLGTVVAVTGAVKAEQSKMKADLGASARVTSIRVLDENPPRYAIESLTKIGVNHGDREVVCSANGSTARLSGHAEGDVSKDAKLIHACRTVAVAAALVALDIEAATETLTQP